MKKLGLGTFGWAFGLVLFAGCPPLVDEGDGDGDDTDDPCAAVRCPGGTHCEVTEVQCIQAPCPPLVECVANDETSACAVRLCPPDTICVDTEDGGTDCVPAGQGEPCGDVTCGKGFECCNASCGLCVPPDGACIQIACEDEDPPDLTCASVLCLEGTTCVETPEGPECVPQTTCAVVLCIEGTTCIETPEGAQCVPHEENPCHLIDCQIGHTCIVEDGEGKCIPVEPDGCTGYECEQGQHCELLPTPCPPPPDDEVVPPDYCPPVPACVDDAPCSVSLCPIDTYCDDISGTAECIPLPSCDGVECEDGLVCELVEVQCVRAPCPPQPSCVKPGANACDVVRCAAGTHCELVEVVCVTEPCLPVAECVADGWCGMP